MKSVDTDAVVLYHTEIDPRAVKKTFFYHMKLNYRIEGDTCFIEDGITKIGRREANQIKGEFTRLVFPDTLISIGESAFARNILLESIQLPNCLTEIGANAFLYCDELKSLIIPGTVTSIGKDAFHGCKKLNSVSIQNGVKVIKDGAFDDCPKLETVFIPESVDKYGRDAFRKRTFKDLYLSNGPSSYGPFVTAFESGYFGGASKDHAQLFHEMGFYKDEIGITLHVPQGTETDYKMHPFFGKFAKVEIR